MMRCAALDCGSTNDAPANNAVRCETSMWYTWFKYIFKSDAEHSCVLFDAAPWVAVLLFSLAIKQYLRSFKQINKWEVSSSIC